MSYEGYKDCICANGHLTSQDAYEDHPCVVCEAPIVWVNEIDQTNGEDVGYISSEDMRSFCIERETTSKCPTCHSHTLYKPAVYRVPTPEETASIRTITTFFEDQQLQVYLKDMV